MEAKVMYEKIVGAFLSGLVDVGIALVSHYLSEKRERQKWRRRQIYRPLYNETTNLMNNLWEINSQFSSRWEQVDEYSKLAVTEKLRERLNDYTENITKLQERNIQIKRILKTKAREICEEVFSPLCF